MINHIRTLLMNLSGDKAHSPRSPGAEFVPPGYQAKTLPNYLNTAHVALFGASPDQLFLNYRLRQYMALLHETELKDITLLDDNRVTYWPPRGSSFVNDIFGATYSAQNGANKLYFFDEHTADTAAGRAEQHWNVSVLSFGLVTITTRRPSQVQSVATYTVTGGLSTEIALPQSPLRIRLKSPLIGHSWEIQAIGPPTTDLSGVFAILEGLFTTGELSELFAPPLEEPMLSLRNTWASHNLYPYRMGALLLAIALRIDDLTVTAEE